ncbi:somatostatin receptor type 2-like [Saccoglossus kowalevskii]|uniref:Somatostatin receptor type 4-like n=1 Tax=Saccoglossus kowalevskii TaxID=10224 RepID=A0ABM0MH37_SACKO|nr:PREDICTED: somatostatin receptor type 4-like [Saccoglossus kowalevskii]
MYLNATIADYQTDVYAYDKLNYSTSNNTIDDFINPFASILWLKTIFIPTIFGVICFSGLLGNGIVVCVLMRYSDLKTVPNVYILNLASADLLFMLGIPFLAYQYTGKTWLFGKAMCKLVMGIDGINMFAGIFTLTAMCIDRYLAIVNAIESMTYRTVNSARLTCIFIWILAVMATLPLWIYADTKPGPAASVRCDIYFANEVIHNAFIIYGFIIGFALPLLVISLCYFRILIYLNRGTPSTYRTSKRHSKRSSLGRAGIIVMLAVALFTVCWLPFWVIQFITTFNAAPNNLYSVDFIIVYYSSMCLSYANSCLNPVVYTCAGGNFRQKLIRMCLGRKRIDYYTSHNSYFRRSSACVEDVVCELPTMTTTMSSQQVGLITCANEIVDNQL